MPDAALSSAYVHLGKATHAWLRAARNDGTPLKSIAPLYAEVKAAYIAVNSILGLKPHTTPTSVPWHLRAKNFPEEWDE
jgi:hypothetical protein